MLGTMKGWVDHGDEVYMICQKKGSIEGDKYVIPCYVGLSKVFLVWEWLHINILHRNNPNARNLFVKFGFPPMRIIKKEIDRVNPDLVILREKSLYTALVYSYCKRKGYKSILSTQSPAYSSDRDEEVGLRKVLTNLMIPSVRITPVMQRGVDMTGKKKAKNVFFAPFVVEPMILNEKRDYYKDGYINILDVGKYEERKNHFMVVDVIKKLLPNFPNIMLTIVGEVDDDYAREYYVRLKNKVIKDGIKDHVILLMNYKPEQVSELYKHADLNILASTAESASVCIVEAMSYSTPAICSTDNGTADYIIPGETGEIFEDCNGEDLYNKVLSIIIDKENIPRMGLASYKRVCDNFGFTNYYEAVMEAADSI